MDPALAKLLEDDDVSDPSDWPEGPLQGGIAKLDSLLRCDLCKDVLEAPVLLACGHGGCSKCIRSSFSGSTAKCPTCSAQTSDNQIRKNTMLEEVCFAWGALRPGLLQHMRDYSAPSSKSAKRRRSPPPPSAPAPATAEHRVTRSRSNGTRSAPSETVVIPSTSEAEEEDEDAYSPSPKQKRRREESPPAPAARDGIVTCPMCQTTGPEADINEHLDNDCCWPKPKRSISDKLIKKGNGLAGGAVAGSSKSATPARKPSKSFFSASSDKSTRSPAAPASRIPKTNYNVLKDKALLKLLEDAGIPTSGDRTTQIERHKRWTLIWNANTDSARPKTRAELKRELVEWDRARENDRKGRKGSKASEDDWRRLIAQAKPKDKGKGMARSKAINATPVSAISVDSDVSDHEAGGSTSPVSAPASAPAAQDQEPERSRFFGNDDDGEAGEKEGKQNGAQGEEAAVVAPTQPGAFGEPSLLMEE